MPRRLLVPALSVVLAAAALGACSSERPAEERAASPATTAGGDAAPSTSGPESAGRDGAAAFVRLMRLRNEVYMAPEPERVDRYVAPECPCYDAERQALTELEQNGWRWVTPVLQVVGLRVDESSDDRVTMTVVGSRPGERVESGPGELVQPQGEGLAPTGFRAVVVRREGAWRIADFAPLELDPAAIEEVIQAGLPAA